MRRLRLRDRIAQPALRTGGVHPVQGEGQFGDRGRNIGRPGNGLRVGAVPGVDACAPGEQPDHKEGSEGDQSDGSPGHYPRYRLREQGLLPKALSGDLSVLGVQLDPHTPPP